MKRITLLSAVIFSVYSSAQAIIGDGVGTATNKTSVLLEFAATGDAGIILPYVTDKSKVNMPGSIILDATVPSQAKVKFYTGSAWTDLSVQTANVTNALLPQQSAQEKESAKTVIGNTSSTAHGILVLESKNKAMVLPVTNDYKKIINPAPGTMTLINNGGILSLAVYDGANWNFWSY